MKISMEEFVILFHEMPPGNERPSHWDLMLKQDGELLTWALPLNPFTIREFTVQRLPNHRLEYLEFEGPISGQRGTVKQIAKGRYHWLNLVDTDNWKAQFNFSNGRNWTVKLVGSEMISIQKLDSSSND